MILQYFLIFGNNFP